MPRRCALGCPPSGTRMHCFPDPEKYPDKFLTWANLAGVKLETASEKEYYHINKRICDIHFTPEDKNRYNRLNALAVPTLHLPANPVNQNNSASNLVTVEQPSSSVDSGGVNLGGSIDGSVTKEHNYSVISRPDWKETRKLLKNPCRAPVYNPTLIKPLQTKIKYLRTEISRLRRKGKTFKARLNNAEKLSKDMVFNQVVQNMKKPAQLFLQMQLQSTKKSKGRRFTLEQKVLSLSLYKRSPRSYGLLYKYFTLPSVKSMKRLLSKIKLSPGINPIIFKKIKKTISEKEKRDRLCSLIFDEMSLTPQIFYNTQKDFLEGFTTTNDGKKFADHALVFMVKGLKSNFKQPIAYYFTNSLQKIELKKIITDVIKHAQDANLIIVNTVCDQSTVNVGAVTDLINGTKQNYLRQGKECRHDFFRVNGHNIIPIFDAPHLIKGIRNNLITKDLRYTSNGEEKLVKWEYFEMVYRADKSYGELRLLDKITEEHINQEKLNKMKVKLATQLFSHSVAVVAEHLTARGDLPQECRQIIDFLLIMDNLFDSLNVNSFQIPNGKKYKGPVKRHSPHHQLWQDAKAMLRTVKFIEKKTVGDKILLIEKIVPSITNFIKTIEGVEAIWRVVSQKYSCDALLTRNLNQDPAENFFGNIRSYGARNVAPNSVAFEGAFKALLLNNYSSPHSARANCEEDQNECLHTLQFLVTEKQEVPDVSVNEDIPFDKDLFNDENIEVNDAGQRNYVCGWVLTKCLKHVVKSCQQCRQTLLDSDNSNTNNKFIKAKEYSNKKWLCYPSSQLENCFQNLQDLTEKIMTKETPNINIKLTILSYADMIIDFPFSCQIHGENLKKYFVSTAINILLHSWCRSINRILSGKIVYHGDDFTKNAAQRYYNKHRHYRNKK